jgi:amidase
MLAAHGIDAVVGLADARMSSVASLAGYAVGAMPLGYAHFNGRAWGMAIITGAYGEGKMLEIMSAWESTFGHRWMPPPLLRDSAANGNF